MKLQLKWLILFLLLFLSWKLEATLILLKNGTLVQGEILEYTETTILIRRLDNGGTIEIPWNEMEPVCQQKIKEKLGVIEPKECFTIPGVKLYLKIGGTVLGELVSQKENYVEIQTKSSSNPLRIPKDNIYKIESTQVSILCVYSLDKIYQKYQKNYDLQKGEGHFQFAQFLLSLGAYEKAQFHFEQAEKLQPKLSSQIAILKSKAKQLQEEEKNQKELARIQQYRKSRYYTKALKMLEEIKANLTEEHYLQLNEEILSEQKKYLQKEIPSRYLKKVLEKIHAISQERSIKLADAREQTKNKIPQLVVEELSRDFSISPEDVQVYIQEKLPVPTRQYRYGEGTFIVSSPSKKEYLDEDLKIRFTGSEVKPSKTPEQWWQEASYSSRNEWLCAYFFENASLGEIITKECPYCEGKGRQLSKRKIVVCPICQGCGHERLVSLKGK